MTQDKFELSVAPRSITGKKTKKLRAEGLIPANIFGEVEKSVAISISAKDFQNLQKKASETSIVYLQVEGEKDSRPTLIDEVEMNSLTGSFVHVSFRQVNLKEAVTAPVPVKLIGELGITGATAMLVREEIEVEALPTDLPEAFEIDLATFTVIGQEVAVKDLKFDRSKVKVSIEEDEKVLMIQEEEQMAEVEETPTEVQEVETTEMGKPEEAGEAGEAKPAEEPKEEEKKS